MEQHPRVLDALAKAGSNQSNVPRFLAAAFDIGFPVLELPAKIVQYGQGHRGRWLNSTFTDASPAIGARLARDKLIAATFLRQSGIPVPVHRLVANSAEAIEAAESLGYPVVVKPADLDGGRGVTAHLDSAQPVASAFDRAAALSRRVLVEKHVAGRDYRLTVFNGRMIWAVERVPGGITGDGLRTVEELVTELNLDPRRGAGAHSPLKKLELDSEAALQLSKQGLHRGSVPPAGHFVRMRTTSNIATGGMPVAVTEQVHPDNALLAERAASALRLDLAGIDLLIPDIGKSWRDGGAAICEVNGQPNIGGITAGHLYGQILRELVPGNGRIPITVVMGGKTGNAIACELVTALSSTGLIVGLQDDAGVHIAAKPVHVGSASTFDGATMLLLDTSVQAMVIQLSGSEVLETGLPFAEFDLLILTREALDASDGRPQADKVLAALWPGCAAGVLWVDDEPNEDVTPVLSQFSPRLAPCRVSREELTKHALQLLQRREASHASGVFGGVQPR